LFEITSVKKSSHAEFARLRNFTPLGYIFRSSADFFVKLFHSC